MEEITNNKDVSPEYNMCPGCYYAHGTLVKCSNCRIEFCEDCISDIYDYCGTKCVCRDIVCKWCYDKCSTCGVKVCRDCGTFCSSCYNSFCENCNSYGKYCKDCLNE